MEVLKSIALTVANADLEVYARSPNKDKNTVLAIGWAIIIAMVVATAAFIFFLKQLFVSTVPALGGAAVMAAIIYLLDRTLLRDESKMKLALRFFISLCIAIFISVPIKVMMGEEALKTYIVRQTFAYNQSLQAKVDSVRNHIDLELHRINRGLEEASYKNEEGKLIQTQILAELRRQKRELLDTKEQRVAEMQKRVNEQLQTPDTSFVAQMTSFIDQTVNPDEASDPMAWFLNIVIFVFFMISEAMPSILRASMQKSFYLRAVAHKNELIQKIQDRLEQLENLVTNKENTDGNHVILKKVDYFRALALQAVTELKDTDELRALHEELLEAEEEYEREQAMKYPPEQSNSTPKAAKRMVDDEEPEFIYD